MAVVCLNLAEVRQNIDRIDHALVPLLVERAEYVRQAAGFKADKSAVVDQPRIEEIILKVRHMAVEQGGDPDWMEAIYRALIDTAIVFEGREWVRLHQSVGKES